MNNVWWIWYGWNVIVLVWIACDRYGMDEMDRFSMDNMWYRIRMDKMFIEWLGILWIKSEIRYGLVKVWRFDMDKVSYSRYGMNKVW